MPEVWKHIPNYPLYKVSNMGRVCGPKKILSSKPFKNGYIYVTLRNYNTKRKYLVHRLVAEVFLGADREWQGYRQVIDHIDQNTLNNKANNLRIVTQNENMTNVDTSSQTSKYPGVCWAKYHKKWEATIRIDGKKHFLGRYDDELQAANAYSLKLKELKLV